MKRFGIGLAAIAALVLTPTEGARVPGDAGGVVSLRRVGPLVMNRSDQAEVVAYAGPPEQVQSMDRLGNVLHSAAGPR